MEHDYGEIKGCEICFKAFGLTRHRHKCKRCKLIVCADCGKSKSIIIGYKLKPATPHRVCSICRDDINAQEDVRKRFGTSWNTLSSVAIEWLNVCHALKELDFKGSNNYKKYLEDSATEHEIKPIISDLIDDISQGRADRESFNYSLTEFLYYSQQGRDRDTVRKNVENVLRAFYTRYTELGHTTLLINVATLLLCFADEETVFYLLCYIKEKLLPENFYDSVSSPLPYLGLVKEKYILKKTIINVLNSDFPRPNMKHVEVVYNKAANALLGGLMVDLANFRTQFYIWNEMFNQNSMKPLEMSIIKVFKHSKNYFEQYHSMTLYNYRIFVCRNIQPDTLKNDPLEFTDETKNQEAQSFDSTALDEILEERRIFTNSLELFRGLSQNDTHLIMDRIRRMIQEVRSVQKSNVTAIPISEADFLALFKDVEATQQLEGEDLAKVYRALDLEKEEKLSSRVLAGLIILLVSEDLASKLNDIFSLFAHDGQITSNETPQVISFLEEVLPVLNEANATYLNFQIHLYEMLEKLKSKIKKMQKITPQDFEAIMSKYPVFQLVTGERRNLGRSSSLLSYVSMTTNEEDSASEKGGPIDEQEFENILDEQVVEKIVDHEPEVQQPQERFEEKYEEKPYEAKYEEQPYEQKYEEQPYEQKYEEQPYEEKYEEKPYVEEIQREAESPEQIITNEETQKKSESSESVIEQTSPESPDVYVNVAPTPEQEFINPTAESNSPKPDQTYTIGNRFGIQLIMPAPQVEERVEEQVEEQVQEKIEEQVEPVQEEERIISQVTQEIPRQHHHTVHDVQVTAQEEYDPEEAERRARLAEEIVEIYEPEEQQQEEAPQPVNERLDWRHPEEERARAYIPNADEIHDVLGKSGFDKYSVTFNEEVPQAVQKQEETDYEVIKSEEETVQKYDQSVGEYTTTVKEEEAVVEETQGKVKLVEANESFLVKDTTADNTVADIETSFYNEPKIKQQINEAERKVVNRDTRSVVEKESGCKLCNMF